MSTTPTVGSYSGLSDDLQNSRETSFFFYSEYKNVIGGAMFTALRPPRLHTESMNWFSNGGRLGNVTVQKCLSAAFFDTA